MKSPVVNIDILIIKSNKVLLGLFTDKWSHKGQPTYGLPGREIEFGETFGEAIKRNVKEELGCETLNYSIIAVNSNYAFDNHYVGVGSLVEIEGEPKLMKPEDWKEWGWFKLDDLPSNLFPPAQNLINSYLQHKITVSE